MFELVWKYNFTFMKAKLSGMAVAEMEQVGSKGEIMKDFLTSNDMIVSLNDLKKCVNPTKRGKNFIVQTFKMMLCINIRTILG